MSRRFWGCKVKFTSPQQQCFTTIPSSASSIKEWKMKEKIFKEAIRTTLSPAQTKINPERLLARVPADPTEAIRTSGSGV